MSLPNSSTTSAARQARSPPIPVAAGIPSCPFCAIAQRFPPSSPVISTPIALSISADPSPPTALSPVLQDQDQDQDQDQEAPPQSPNPLAASPLSSPPNEQLPRGLLPSETPTHILLSTPLVVAFLDIFPLTRGHLLLIPRTHHEKTSDLPASTSAALGAWLPLLSRAATKVSGYTDFNIVQNNGVNAAQVVPHVHFHVIPRPDERQREGLLREREEREREEIVTFGGGGQGGGEGGVRLYRSPFGDGWRQELDDEEGVEIARRIREELRNELELLGKDSDGRKERDLLSHL